MGVFHYQAAPGGDGALLSPDLPAAARVFEPEGELPGHPGQVPGGQLHGRHSSRGVVWCRGEAEGALLLIRSGPLPDLGPECRDLAGRGDGRSGGRAG